MSDRPLIWVGDDALCPECRAPVTTGMMAAFCPRRERCEFWPHDADESSIAFLDWIGGRRDSPDDGMPESLANRPQHRPPEAPETDEQREVLT